MPLPLSRLRDAALGRAAGLGAAEASVHATRTRIGRHRVIDADDGDTSESDDLALGVRVVVGGKIGYAATTELTPEAASATAADAVALASACAPLEQPPLPPLGLAPRTVRWVSPHEIDPLELPVGERVAHLAGWSRRLLAHPAVASTCALLTATCEYRYYADSAGNDAIHKRISVHPMVIGTAVDRAGRPTSLRTSGPPSGRGWEYLLGTGWDWEGELGLMPDLLAEKQAAQPVNEGRYDLVLDPSNSWMAIHETIGHAFELDRMQGHERSYAGTSFAAASDVGAMRIGSDRMNIVADRTAEHGLATVAMDDEGVGSGAWQLVADGILVGAQTDRLAAARAGLGSSMGCSFADSALRPPINRMANVSLVADPDGPTTAGLVDGIDDGLYFAGTDGWSVDADRGRFRFTGQRCHRIRRGRIEEQVVGAGYQGDTQSFWGALAALGGPETTGMFGADLCGKGQPVQISAASHSAPVAVFSGIDVIRVT